MPRPATPKYGGSITSVEGQPPSPPSASLQALGALGESLGIVNSFFEAKSDKEKLEGAIASKRIHDIEATEAAKGKIRQQNSIEIQYDSIDRSWNSYLAQARIDWADQPMVFMAKTTDYLEGLYSDMDQKDPRTSKGMTKKLSYLNGDIVRIQKASDNKEDVEHLMGLNLLVQDSSNAIGDFAVKNLDPDLTQDALHGVHDVLTGLASLVNRTRIDGSPFYTPAEHADMMDQKYREAYNQFAARKIMAMNDPEAVQEVIDQMDAGTFEMEFWDEDLQGIGAISVSDVHPNVFTPQYTNLYRAATSRRSALKQGGRVVQEDILTSFRETAAIELFAHKNESKQRLLESVIVYDADTIGGIDLLTGKYVKYRFAVSDAPELYKRTFNADGTPEFPNYDYASGENATARLKQLLGDEDAQIYVIPSGVATDRYGRTVARIYVKYPPSDEFPEGRIVDVGAELIREGFSDYNADFGRDPYIMSLAELAAFEVDKAMNGNANRVRGSAASDRHDGKGPSAKPYGEFLDSRNFYTPPKMPPVPESKWTVRTPKDFEGFPNPEAMAKSWNDEVREKHTVAEIENTVEILSPSEAIAVRDKLLVGMHEDMREFYTKTFADAARAKASNMEKDSRGEVFKMHPELADLYADAQQMPFGDERTVMLGSITAQVSRIAQKHSGGKFRATLPESDIKALTDILDNEGLTYSQFGSAFGIELRRIVKDQGGDYMMDEILTSLNIDKRFTPGMMNVVFALHESENENGAMAALYNSFLTPYGKSEYVINRKAEFKSLKVVTFNAMGEPVETLATDILESRLKPLMLEYVSAVPAGSDWMADVKEKQAAVRVRASWILATSLDPTEQDVKQAVDDAYADIIGTQQLEYHGGGHHYRMSTMLYKSLDEGGQKFIDNNFDQIANWMRNDGGLDGTLVPLDSVTSTKQMSTSVGRFSTVRVQPNPVTGEAEFILILTSQSNEPVLQRVEGLDGPTTPVILTVTQARERYKGITSLQPYKNVASFLLSSVPFSGLTKDLFKEDTASESIKHPFPLSEEHSSYSEKSSGDFKAAEKKRVANMGKIQGPAYSAWKYLEKSIAQVDYQFVEGNLK